MRNDIDFSKLPDSKVKIYARTTEAILEKCLKKCKAFAIKNPKAGIKAHVSRSGMISEVAEAVFSHNILQKEFILKKEKAIRLAAEIGDRYATIGFDHPYLYALCILAEIPDLNYLVFDQSFGPLEKFPVLFKTKPFHLLDLIRLPDFAELSETADGYLLETGDGKVAGGTVTCVSPFTMPGDRHPYWLEVRYRVAETVENLIYVTCLQSGRIQRQETGELLDFFLGRL